MRNTKYVTEAEAFGWSFVFEPLVPPTTLAQSDGPDGLGRVRGATHWIGVKGAFWRRPEGPESSIKLRETHPVSITKSKLSVGYV